MEKSLSVIIPAYNEGSVIATTLAEVLWAIDGKFAEYEIIIVNDGSSDNTGRIIDDLAANNPHVLAVHNKRNLGFGASYRKGIELAHMKYVGIFPGDNEVTASSIAAILDYVGHADIVVPYTMNMEVRPYMRRVLSRLYSLILNMLYCCELQYYNGPAIHLRAVLLNAPVNTNGLAFLSTLLIRLVRSGHSFIEVGMYLRPRQAGKSSALKLKSILSVLAANVCLVKNIFWDDRKAYAKPIHRVQHHDIVRTVSK
jgi:glycosyltransferase involved in cell wall biosynthesis